MKSITEEIQNLVALKYSAEDIMAHLRKSGYSYTEIQQNLPAIRKAKIVSRPHSGRRSVIWTIVLLIVAVLRGPCGQEEGTPELVYL